jgi:hypothetical protein
MIGSNILTRCGVHTTLFVLRMTKKLNGPINYLGDVGLCNSCFCLLLVEVEFPLVLVAFNVFFLANRVDPFVFKEKCTITFSKGFGCRSKTYG